MLTTTSTIVVSQFTTVEKEDVRSDLLQQGTLVKWVDGSPKLENSATRLAFVRQILQDKRHGIKLDIAATAVNQADLFTKGLGKTKT